MTTVTVTPVQASYIFSKEAVNSMAASLRDFGTDCKVFFYPVSGDGAIQVEGSYVNRQVAKSYNQANMKQALSKSWGGVELPEETIAKIAAGVPLHIRATVDGDISFQFIPMEPASIDMTEVNTKFEHARQLEQRAKDLRREARNQKNEIMTALVPFRVGDVIAYRATMGKHTRNLKMRVDSMHLWTENTVEVYGRQVNKAGNVGNSTAFFYSLWGTTPVEVL